MSKLMSFIYKTESKEINPLRHWPALCWPSLVLHPFQRRTLPNEKGKTVLRNKPKAQGFCLITLFPKILPSVTHLAVGCQGPQSQLICRPGTESNILSPLKSKGKTC